MAEEIPGSPVTPTVMYKDPKAALKWLSDAFGFETALLVADDDGNIAHAETSFRDCRIGVAGEWEAPMLGAFKARSPASLGGQGSQFLWLDLEDGIDDHCAHARAAGARITQEPEDQFYGARTYRALDPEGHVWCFRQTVAALTVPQMESASGLKFVDSV
jgi:uncharacterized glyoxalase superfamily protein PhnB